MNHETCAKESLNVTEESTNEELFDYAFNNIIYVPDTTFYDATGNLLKPNGFQPPQNGIVILYSKDGFEQINIPYINGKITGTSIIYYDNTKVIASISNYKEDKLDGESMCFSETGHIERMENFNNGVKEGLQELFYKNKQLKSKSNFMDNLETVQSQTLFGKLLMQ